jgi:hypothetical protein
MQYACDLERGVPVDLQLENFSTSWDRTEFESFRDIACLEFGD